MKASFFRPAGQKEEALSKASPEKIFEPAVIIREIKKTFSPKSTPGQCEANAETLKKIHNDEGVRVETRCNAMLLRAKLLEFVYSLTQYYSYDFSIDNYNKARELCVRIPVLLMSIVTCLPSDDDERLKLLQNSYAFAKECGPETLKAFMFSYKSACDSYKSKLDQRQDEDVVLNTRHWNAML